MGTNVFISFRFNDGKELKEEIEVLFDSSTDVYNRSENVDRSEMSKETIRNYLYGKLKETSVTIVLLTPNAVNEYGGTKAPVLRTLAPPSAENSSKSAEGAPLL